LDADTGSIGTSTQNIKTVANTVTANTGGSGNVFITNTGSVTLGDSTSGGTFQFKAIGSLTANDIETGNGSINLISSGTTLGNVTLAVAPSSQIVANGGNITLQNTNSTIGQIEIGDGSFVNAIVTKPVSSVAPTIGGNVTIFIGTSATKQAGSAPVGINTDVQAPGAIFFGTNGITKTGVGTSDVNALGANVVFSKPAAAGTAIKVGAGVVIEADPPIGASNPPQVTPPPAENSSSSGNSTPVAIVSTVGTTAASGVTPNSASNISRQSFDTVMPSTTAAYSNTKKVRSADEDLVSISFVKSGPAVSTTAGAGDVLYAPTADSTIPTAHGDIRVKAGSLVFVTTSGGTTAIYNLHDSCKNAVSVTTSNGVMPLSTGHAMIVSNKESIDLNDSNPVWSIGHRNTKTSNVGGVYMLTAEFSLASALTRIPALVALVQSKDPQQQRLAQQLMKTAAVLMFVNKNGEPYRPVPKRPLLTLNR
jgi:hypothetical protein